MGEFLAAEKLCGSLEPQAKGGCLNSCGFNNRNSSFLIALEAGSLIRVSVWPGSGESPLPGRQLPSWSRCVPPWQREVREGDRGVSGVPSCKDPNPISRAHPQASSQPDIPEAPSPKRALSRLELPQHMSVGVDTIQSIEWANVGQGGAVNVWGVP